MLLTNDRGVPSRPAGVRCEQGTATARPSKRVPYSVQQTGGDNRRGRDKNDCDQVMQHVVSHVTLLGWLWIWKGHPLLPGQSATIVINGDEIVIAGGDGLLAQGSPAVQENVCRAIARAAEVTLSRYAAAFELQLKLAEWSRRASISV